MVKKVAKGSYHSAEGKNKHQSVSGSFLWQIKTAENIPNNLIYIQANVILKVSYLVSFPEYSYTGLSSHLFN